MSSLRQCSHSSWRVIAGPFPYSMNNIGLGLRAWLAMRCNECNDTRTGNIRGHGMRWTRQIVKKCLRRIEREQEIRITL